MDHQLSIFISVKCYILIGLLLIFNGVNSINFLFTSIEKNLFALQVVSLLTAEPTYNPSSLKKSEAGVKSRRFNERTSEINPLNSFAHLDPPKGPSRIGAFFLFAQGNYQQAEQLLTKLNKDSDDKLLIYHFLGLSAWRRNDSKSAIEYWKTSHSDILWMTRAIEYVWPQGDFEGGIKFAEMAHAVAPENMNHVQMLGKFYEYAGDRAKAKEIYEIALINKCKSYVCEMMLGRLYFLKDEFQNAILHYEQAHKLNEKQAEPLFYIALVYLQSCSLKEAFDYLDRARMLDEDPNHFLYLQFKWEHEINTERCQ